jgi:CheY-like chemotaxis protein
MEKELSNKVHVVLADDDLDDSYIFNVAVEQSNLPIELSIAEDGQKLLTYLSSNPLPDIIFLDINMPLKNGIECLSEIRSNYKYKEVPVVMYSTTNNRLNVDACYDGGAHLYIVKPNTFEEVDRIVKKICSKEWAANVKVPPKEEFILSSF